MRFFVARAAALIFIAFPIVVFAWAPGQPIVPQCFGGGPYCQACDFMQLVNNVVAFAVYFSAFVATVMFAYAGFLYVTAASNQENLTKAKSIFGKVLLGFFFILTAWLIIDIVLSVTTNKDFGFWTNINCVKSPTLSDATPTTVGVGSPGQRCVEGDGGCLSQADAALILSEGGVTVRSSGNCSDPNNQSCTSLKGLQKDTAEDVVALNKALGGGVDVTAGTEAGHRNACHINGTCVDIDVSGVGSPDNYNVDRINQVIEESGKVGRRAVFEPAPGASCPAGVTSCQEVSWATGDGHFSFYK